MVCKIAKPSNSPNALQEGMGVKMLKGSVYCLGLCLVGFKREEFGY